MGSWGLGLKLACVSALAATSLAVVATSARSSAGVRSLASYEGTGSWVSIYDGRAWRNPERVVQTLAANGVSTLFLETSNYKQSVDVVRPAVVARFLDAAHAAGISVVAWYLPSLAAPQRELRRALAAVRFRTADGESFDSVALDIEATTVGSISLRNARAISLAAALRRAVAPAYPLGAITIAPVGSSPSYWPTYPFAGLARNVDVFLPMEYFTARTRGATGVAAYSVANLRLIGELARRTGFPIHPIGGEAHDATLPELRAFFTSIAGCSIGASLWEYGETSPKQWSLLNAAAAPASGLAETGC